MTKTTTIKIKLFKDRASIIDGKYLTFDQLNFPNFAYFFENEAYLVVEILNYVESDELIYCKILSYNRGKCYFNIEQKNQAEF